MRGVSSGKSHNLYKLWLFITETILLDEKDDAPEQVREMIEVFESREEMQLETTAKKIVSIEKTDSICLSTAEYYGLVITSMLLISLLMIFFLMIGIFYK